MFTFLTEHFSYGLLFVWSLLEGEIGLALAGFLSQKGGLDFMTVVAIAFCGAIISDTALYLIGKRYKRLTYRLLKHHTRILRKIGVWLHRYGGWVIVFDRFIYGTHIPAMLFLGISRYPFKKFILLEIIGVGLWSVTFTSLGYLFGEKVFTLIQLVQKNLLLLFVFAVLVLIVYKNRSK
jgi:membrane protein DedA with SNARE-associated domain